MTKRDSTLETATPQALHHYTVSYRTISKQRSPLICIKGNWLARAGFTTGTLLSVQVMKGCLVINALPQPTLIEQMLQTAEQLSEERQQELAIMIEAMLLRERLADYHQNDIKIGG